MNVLPATLVVRPGGRLACKLPAAITTAGTAALQEKLSSAGTETRVELRKDNRTGVSLVDRGTLTADTIIQTQSHGAMTLREYWESSFGKLRCQSPFRDSSSWNGILNRHADGTPYVYDNGTRTRYELADDEVKLLRVDAIKTRLQRMSAAETRTNWLRMVMRCDAAETSLVVAFVAQLTGIGVRTLHAQLKQAKTTLAEEQRKADAEETRNAATAEGKAVKNFDEEMLIPLADEIASILGQPESWDDSRRPVLALGSTLVTVAKAKPVTVKQIVASKLSAYPETHLFLPYTTTTLIRRIMEQFAIAVPTKDGIKIITPPSKLTAQILETGHDCVPSVVGIVEYPLVMPDGLLHVEQGYHVDTGLFVAFDPALTPTLPDVISQQDAAESLRWLREELLKEFPFVSDRDRDAAISCALVLLMRPFLVSESGFPGYAVSAPTQGTGKTTLLELIWRAVFGRPIPVQAWPGVEEEVAKVILAILLEGHPGILWDNLPDNRPFDSATIAKTMTSEMLSGRVLGETRTATALSGAVQLFTGNNVTPAGDLATRILPIVLDARLERPDARQFTRPAWADWVDIHRAEVLHHLLTILVGGITARTSVPTPSRFPAWDRLVRGPLLWAGGLDPAELFERNLQADPIRNNHQELVAALYGVYGEGTFLARHVTCDHTDPHHLYDNKGRRVWDVLRDIAGGRPISNRSLGIHLARAAGKQLGRYRLVRSRVDRDGAQWWRIECSSSVEFPMREWRRVNQSLLHKFPEIQKLYAPCPPPLPHSHLVPLTSSEAA